MCRTMEWTSNVLVGRYWWAGWSRHGACEGKVATHIALLQCWPAAAGIWVDPDEKKSLVLEVSIKWCGDPNITLAIATTALG